MSISLRKVSLDLNVYTDNFFVFEQQQLLLSKGLNNSQEKNKDWIVLVIWTSTHCLWYTYTILWNSVKQNLNFDLYAIMIDNR